MSGQANDIIAYILWLASEEGIELTPIRLVKFLYLADLYHARFMEGQTMTGWDWRFHHFGPWSPKYHPAITATKHQPWCRTSKFESNFEEEEAEVYSYNFHKKPAYEPPIFVKTELKSAIKQLGRDTYALLNHVYFETEPMKDAKPEEYLDFTLAKRPTPIKAVHMKEPSKTAKNKAKDLLKALVAANPRPQPVCVPVALDEAGLSSVTDVDHGLRMRLNLQLLVKE